MTRSDRGSAGEDAFYVSLFAFLRRNAIMVPLFAPLVVLAVFPDGTGLAGVVLVMVIYLGEAIAYAGLQRHRGVQPAEIATSLTNAGRWGWKLIVATATLVAVGISKSVE